MFIRIISISVNRKILKIKRWIKKYNINTNEKKVSIALLISDQVNYICKEGQNDKTYFRKI